MPLPVRSSLLWALSFNEQPAGFPGRQHAQTLKLAQLLSVHSRQSLRSCNTPRRERKSRLYKFVQKRRMSIASQVIVRSISHIGFSSSRIERYIGGTWMAKSMQAFQPRPCCMRGSVRDQYWPRRCGSSMQQCILLYSCASRVWSFSSGRLVLTRKANTVTKLIFL